MQKEDMILKLLQDVAIIANEARSTEEALQFTLNKVCSYTGWPYGHVYSFTAPNEIVSANIWHCRDETQLEKFRRAMARTPLRPGEGWLGKVFSNGRSTWMADESRIREFTRRYGMDGDQVKAIFAFPVMVGGEVAAVFVFFSPEAVEPDEAFLEAMSIIGTQVSRVIEREQAQKALQESEYRFQAIFNQTIEQLKQSEMLLAKAQRLAHLGSWEWELEQNKITWSEEMHRIYGVPPEEDEMTYEGVMAYTHPEDRPILHQFIQNSLATKHPYELYYRLIRPDNSIRTIHARGEVVLDKSGEPSRLIGTCQDITEQEETEAKLTQNAQQLAALNSMGQTVVASLNLEVVFDRVLASLLPLLRAEGVFILLKEGEELVFAATNEVGEENLQGQRVAATEGVAGKVLSAGKSVWLRGEETKERVYRQLTQVARYYPGAILAVPLHLHGELIGVMEAVHQEEDRFTAADLSVLETAAAWTAIAIGNARRHEDIRRRLQESEAMATISRALSETLDLEQVLQLIVDATWQIIPTVDWATIHLLDDKTGILYPAAIAGVELKPEDYAMNPGEGIAGLVMEKGEVVNVQDLQQDARRLPIDQTMNIRSLLVAPVQSHSGRLGTISVQCSVPNAYHADDERLLSTLGMQAALAIENARLFKAQRQARVTAETLRAAHAALTQTLDFDTVGNTLLDYLHQLVEYNSASLLLTGSDASYLQVAAYRTHHKNNGRRQPLYLRTSSYPHLQTVVSQKQSLLLNDTSKYPSWRPHNNTFQSIGSWLGIPLTTRNELIGLISICHAARNRFNDENRLAVEALAAQASSAIQNARLFHQVRTGRERLRHLSSKIVSAQEEERQRVSRELHDEAGQALTALKISLDLIKTGLPSELEVVHKNIEDAITLTDKTMENIRLLAHALRPPALDAFKLNETLAGLCDDFAERTGLSIKYKGLDLPPLPDSVAVSLYRLLQEALTNVVKHAQASEVQVTLRRERGEILLAIKDNGQGFQMEGDISEMASAEGIGLIGIRERLELLGGWLAIETEPAGGTQVIGRVPYQEEQTNT